MSGTSEDVTVKIKKNLLSWFGHIERICDVKMAKKIYDGKVSDKRGRGKPWLTFENIVLKILEEGMYDEVDESGRGERGMQRS